MVANSVLKMTVKRTFNKIAHKINRRNVLFCKIVCRTGAKPKKRQTIKMGTYFWGVITPTLLFLTVDGNENQILSLVSVSGGRFPKVPVSLSVYIKDRGFNSFVSNMIKLSVNETKWSSLLPRTRALILYISFWIFDFEPEKLPRLSRNGPPRFLVPNPSPSACSVMMR